MASPENEQVVAHLRRLYAERFAGDEDIEAIVASSRAFLSEYARVDGIAPALDSETAVEAVSADAVSCEWVRAAGATAELRLLWIHGGSWMSGGPADYRHLAEALSKHTSASVLMADYRLAPEHPFPAGLDDCLAAYTWLRAHGPEGPGQARAIWVAGDSAGGNLALALLLKLRESGAPMPAAVATLGAATDLTASGASMESRAALDPVISKQGVDFVARLYVQDRAPLTDPLVSPLFGDLRGLPPILMHVGDREVLLDDSLRFAERAVAAGSQAGVKVWPEMIHVFETFCHLLPEGRQSLEEIAAFLVRHGG